MRTHARLGVLMILAGLMAGAAGLSRATAQPAGRSQAVATFAGGCFWCMEQAFDAVAGVTATTSGYIGGETPNPTYEQVSSGRTGHAEAIEIHYDPSVVTYDRLLEVFWRNVDAVDGGGQFCDRGSQYRSAVFYHSAEQQRLAEASKQAAARRLGQSIQTEVVAAGPFYRAEDYHQDYYTRNPLRYKFYKWNCGREQRLDALWGKTSNP